MSREPYIEHRPWGTFEQFSHNEPSTVKILTVNPGEELSTQYHKHREEFWRVLAGNGEVLQGETWYPAQPGDTFFIKQGMLHSIRGGRGPLQILEIATGDFDENDIVRVTDKYGRTTP
jgi:mannose-6-phosphate isomerase-like protein (cupin superfamily)